jgi:hypothetical protein
MNTLFIPTYEYPSHGREGRRRQERHLFLLQPVAKLPYLYDILTQKCFWLPNQCAADFLTFTPGAVPIRY